MKRSFNKKSWQLHVKRSSGVCVPNSETLEFIVKGATPPFGMVSDVISRFQHEAHELPHVEGVVGELWVVPDGRMVTLREVKERRLSIR